jgi:hypothetical protein
VGGWVWAGDWWGAVLFALRGDKRLGLRTELERGPGSIVAPRRTSVHVSPGACYARLASLMQAAFSLAHSYSSPHTRPHMSLTVQSVSSSSSR